MLPLAAPGEQFGAVSGKFNCPGIGNAMRCAQSIESTLPASVVRRPKPEQLDITLINGSVYSFVDVHQPDSWQETDFDQPTQHAEWVVALGLINSRRYAVIGRFYYEGMSYGLLDRKTGLFSAICGYPLFSPDRRWLVCADTTTENAALQILALDGTGSPTIVFDALPTHWGVDDVSWASPTRLTYSRVTYDIAKILKERRELVYENGAWRSR